MLLTLRDETPSGHEVGVTTLEVPDTITLRDLIRARVREEVARYNAANDVGFKGLVKPEGALAAKDGSYQLAQGRRVDWEAQADVALKAFGKNAFFVVVADRQVEALDDVLDLSEASEVSFVRLVPLVGG